MKRAWEWTTLGLLAALAGCQNTDIMGSMGMSPEQPHSTEGHVERYNTSQAPTAAQPSASVNTAQPAKPVASGQYSQPTGQYSQSSGQYNQPTGQTSSQYNQPYGQNSGTVSTPAGQASGQYNQPYGQTSGTVSTPAGQASGQLDASGRSVQGQAAAPQMQEGNAGQAQQPMAASLSDLDRRFVQIAASSGLFEVKSSQLVLEKSDNADLKHLAQRMVDDHSKLNDQLKTWAQRNNIDWPSQLNNRDQAIYDALSRLSGRDLEQEYLRQQVAAHDEAIRKFRMEATNGQNSELKQLAQQTIPTLESHLHDVQSFTGGFATER